MLNVDLNFIENRENMRPLEIKVKFTRQRFQWNRERNVCDHKLTCPIAQWVWLDREDGGWTGLYSTGDYWGPVGGLCNYKKGNLFVMGMNVRNSCVLCRTLVGDPITIQLVHLHRMIPSVSLRPEQTRNRCEGNKKALRLGSCWIWQRISSVGEFSNCLYRVC